MTGAPDAERPEVDPEMLALFRTEAAQRTAALGAMTGVEDPDQLATLRREAHTLKGTSMILGLTELSRLADRMEGVLLEACVEERLPAEVPGAIRAGSIAFQLGVDALAEGRPVPDEIARETSELEDLDTG